MNFEQLLYFVEAAAVVFFFLIKGQVKIIYSLIVAKWTRYLYGKVGFANFKRSIILALLHNMLSFLEFSKQRHHDNINPVNLKFN
jgi:hypothetical protein